MRTPLKVVTAAATLAGLLAGSAISAAAQGSGSGSMPKGPAGQMPGTGMEKSPAAPMPGMGMEKSPAAPMPGMGMEKGPAAPMPGMGMGMEKGPAAPMPGMGMEKGPAAQMPGMQTQMPGGGMMRMMGECAMGSDMATYVEGRIAFLKAELALTDAQKVAWDNYAPALAKNLQAMQGTRMAMMRTMEAKSPVDRLDSHIATMEGRLAALKEVRPGLGALYSVLSEDQKTKADQLMTGMGCMM